MAQPRKQLQTLIDEIGGGTLTGLDALDADDLQALTDAMRKARRSQQQQLAHALEAALGHVPALLRGPVRKILLPQ